MPEKRQRQQRVLEILARNRIDSQEQLQDLLLAEGVSTTQSTLSRDLRELGIVRGSSGYQLPGSDPTHPAVLQELAEAVREQVRSIDLGGNILVLRTSHPEQAGQLAKRFDGARLHQVAGAVAGEGTVLVVARSPAHARELLRRLHERVEPHRRGRRGWRLLRP